MVKEEKSGEKKSAFIEKVIVESACQLTSEEKAGISKVIEKWLGSKVVLSLKINRDLIGGVKLTVRSVVLDASLKDALGRAREELIVV